MCIISVKKEGIDMPKERIIRKMFSSNNDGAGYMIKRKRSKLIKLSKGYMDVEKFLKALKKEKVKASDIVVMHFRITSVGGTTKELTHPFIGDVEQEIAETLDCKTSSLCFAHNGTMSGFRGNKDRSDTSLFASKVMSSDAIKNSLGSAQTDFIIEKLIDGSRLAVINPEYHDVHIYGDWASSDYEYKWNEGEDKILYSNHTWVPYKGTYYDGFGERTSIDDDDDYFNKVGFQMGRNESLSSYSPLDDPEIDEEVILESLELLDEDFVEKHGKMMKKESIAYWEIHKILTHMGSLPSVLRLEFLSKMRFDKMKVFEIFVRKHCMTWFEYAKYWNNYVEWVLGYEDEVDDADTTEDPKLEYKLGVVVTKDGEEPLIHEDGKK